MTLSRSSTVFAKKGMSLCLELVLGACILLVVGSVFITVAVLFLGMMVFGIALIGSGLLGIPHLFWDSIGMMGLGCVLLATGWIGGKAHTEGIWAEVTA